MNSVILSGRLTKKPELRTTQTLKHVCQFNLAVNRNFNKEVDFIECVCFDKLAENLVKYQDKGNMIELSGKLVTDTYTDKNDKKRSKTYVRVETINYISSSQTSTYTSKNDEKDAYQEMSKRVQEDYQLPF